MNPEVEFVLEALGAVADMQPTDHPLRRVDRDNALVYETGEAIDMSAAIHNRREELRKANYVAVASQSRDNEPIGTEYAHETDVVLSVRVEGLRGFGDEFGHIDPAGNDGVSFEDLYETIRATLLDNRVYPDYSEFTDTKFTLRVTNEDYQSADWADFYRREFDLVFRGKEDLS